MPNQPVSTHSCSLTFLFHNITPPIVDRFFPSFNLHCCCNCSLPIGSIVIVYSYNGIDFYLAITSDKFTLLTMKLASITILLALFIAATLIDADVQQTVDEVTSTKDGATWCPIPLVGTRCPSSSVFHYYHCCGDLLKDCCFNLQVWVIVVLGVVAFIFVAGFVLTLVRFVFCRGR